MTTKHKGRSPQQLQRQCDRSNSKRHSSTSASSSLPANSRVLDFRHNQEQDGGHGGEWKYETTPARPQAIPSTPPKRRSRKRKLSWTPKNGVCICATSADGGGANKRTHVALGRSWWLLTAGSYLVRLTVVGTNLWLCISPTVQGRLITNLPPPPALRYSSLFLCAALRHIIGSAIVIWCGYNNKYLCFASVSVQNKTLRGRRRTRRREETEKASETSHTAGNMPSSIFGNLDEATGAAAKAADKMTKMFENQLDAPDCTKKKDIEARAKAPKAKADRDITAAATAVAVLLLLLLLLLLHHLLTLVLLPHVLLQCLRVLLLAAEVR